MSRQIGAAIGEAKKSAMQFRVGAVVLKGGKILGRGHNTVRSRSGTFKRAMRTPMASMHAEIAALLVTHRKNLKGSTIVVARISFGELCLGNAKPCLHCTKMLKLYGVKKVVYTTGGTSASPVCVVEKMSNVSPAKMSYGNRWLNH